MSEKSSCQYSVVGGQLMYYERDYGKHNCLYGVGKSRNGASPTDYWLPTTDDRKRTSTDSQRTESRTEHQRVP